MNQSDENPNQNRTEQKNYCAYEEKEGTVLTFRRHRRIRPEAEPQGTSTRAKKEDELKQKWSEAEKDWGGQRLGRSAAEIRKKKERLGRPWSEGVSYLNGPAQKRRGGWSARSIHRPGRCIGFPTKSTYT
jgi:hypothetical protein